MIEAEWLAGTDPMPMLEFIRGKVSDRKLRLFAVACCSHVEHLLQAEYVKACRKAIEVLGRHADGLASDQELASAWRDVPADALDAAHAIAHPGETNIYAVSFAAEAVDRVRSSNLAAATQAVAAAIAYDVLTRCGHPTVDRITDSWKPRQWLGRAQWDADETEIRNLSDYVRASAVEKTHQCHWLRCIVGNPFRHGRFMPAWCSTTIKHLAQVIYDDRAFDRLPILADALEEAGCTNPGILNHCRGPGPHVRGCWLIDLLLKKE